MTIKNGDTIKKKKIMFFNISNEFRIFVPEVKTTVFLLKFEVLKNIIFFFFIVSPFLIVMYDSNCVLVKKSFSNIIIQHNNIWKIE